MTERCRPWNSRRQAIQRRTCQSRTMLRSASWRTPRLPISVPRPGMARISPSGETRFLSGIRLGSGERSGPWFHAAAQQAEFVAFDVGEHDPADVLALSNVDTSGAETYQSAQLV